MDLEYFDKALVLATKDDCRVLLKFLNDPKTEQIRESVRENPLIVESSNWKIAFYSVQDIEDAKQFLLDRIQGLVPA